MSTMPDQKPGRSIQSVETPDDFFGACVARFGEFTWDLAASPGNSKCEFFIDEETNSLTKPWHELADNLWLNPPFEKITPWAAKAATEHKKDANIFMLVPASVGSNWYREFVDPYAYVFALSPRLTFVGHKSAYPKDLILCSFNSWEMKGFEGWRWK
jgi:phage N-6-adenine-methyltransferase